MTTWGMPQTIRVDNGAPWGRSGGLPPSLIRWLLGLGVAIHWNHPHRPTENGRVERAHGVLQQWVEVRRCATFTMLQERLAIASRRQREAYPAIHGQSRLAAYPALATNPRWYHADQDAAQWDGQRVHAWLANGMWERRVDSSGKIALAGRNVHVGIAHARRVVTVRFEATVGQWVIRNAHGVVLRMVTTPEVSTIYGLCLAEVLEGIPFARNPEMTVGGNPDDDGEGKPPGA